MAPSGVIIRRGIILSDNLEDNLIRLQLEAFVLGAERRFDLEAEEFFVWDPKSGESVVIGPRNLEEFDTEEEYSINLFLPEVPSSTKAIEDQLALLVEGQESELLFEGLDIYYEK